MSRGGEQLKVSQIAGLIDQIEAGGVSSGGIDLENPKYISFTPNKRFKVYDVMEASPLTNEIHVTFDISDYDYSSTEFYLLYNNLTVKVADENGSYNSEWNINDMITVRRDSPLNKKIQFTGSSNGFPSLFISMNASGEILDMAKVDVYAS